MAAWTWRRTTEAWPWLACALPGAGLAVRAAAGRLGVDPLHTLLHDTGSAAIVLLLATLSISALRWLLTAAARRVPFGWGRRLADWNGLVRLRKPLGLAAFFYAAAHCAVYAALDAGADWTEIAADLRERPFIGIGLAALLLLLPLAATSNAAAMRRLGRHWHRLHLLAYAAAATAVLHDVWQTKIGHAKPWPSALLIGALIALRLFTWRRGARAATIEAAR